jgi:hypothetical protein
MHSRVAEVVRIATLAVATAITAVFFARAYGA